MTTKREPKMHYVATRFDERLEESRTVPYWDAPYYIHATKEGAVQAAALGARASGAPDDARVMIDFDISRNHWCVIVHWYGKEAGDVEQPPLLSSAESWRLGEIES